MRKISTSRRRPLADLQLRRKRSLCSLTDDHVAANCGAGGPLLLSLLRVVGVDVSDVERPVAIDLDYRLALGD